MGARGEVAPSEQLGCRIDAQAVVEDEGSYNIK